MALSTLKSGQTSIDFSALPTAVWSALRLLILGFSIQWFGVSAAESDNWKYQQPPSQAILQLSHRINSELGTTDGQLRKRLHRYSVTLDQALSRADVKVCFEGHAPDYLMIDYEKGNEYLIGYPQVTRGEIEYLGRYWRTSELGKDACLHYVSDLTPYRQSKMNRRKKDRQLLYFSDNTWLWLPEKIAPDEQILIEFQLPKGMEISAPWYRVRGEKNWFVPTQNPHDWGFSMVVGEFEQQSVAIGGGSQLNIALLGTLKQKKQLITWLKDSAQSLASYLGRFPVAQSQIVVIQSQRFRGGPVPWGEVKRGGGLAILFVVNSQMPIEDFYQDWTASHEFAHLLLPKIDYQDSWLSEGLASYLQYILMARAGQLSQEKAWQELLDGFDRGEKGTQNAPAEKLKETVGNRSRGGRSGRTMRIYWSGAAYFFKADVRLRANSDNQMNLPRVLARLNNCCADSGREWKGRELAEKLDKLSESKIFTSLYLAMSESEDFPSVDEELAQLGLDWNGKSVRFSSLSNPWRDAIMAPF